MRERDQLGAGVGHGWITGLRQQSDAFPMERGLQQLREFPDIGVFVKRLDSDLGQWPVEPDPPQEHARGSGLLRNKAVQAADGSDGGLRQHAGGLAFPEGRGD